MQTIQIRYFLKEKESNVFVIFVLNAANLCYWAPKMFLCIQPYYLIIAKQQSCLSRGKGKSRFCAYSGHRPTNYLKFNIYALHWFLILLLFSLLHHSPLSSVPLLFYESHLKAGTLMDFQLNFPVARMLAASQPLYCGSFCPKSTGYPEYENNLFCFYSLSKVV